MPEYFFPIACKKLNGFARIYPEYLPENGYLKEETKSRGPAAPLAPWRVRLWLEFFDDVSFVGFFHLRVLEECNFNLISKCQSNQDVPTVLEFNFTKTKPKATRSRQINSNKSFDKLSCLRLDCEREPTRMCGTNLCNFFYIGVLLVVLSLYICEGNIYTISGRIPQCNKSLDMTVRANSSEDRILLSVHLLDNGHYRSARFVWVSEEWVELCRLPSGICANQKYRTEMSLRGYLGYRSNGTHQFSYRTWFDYYDLKFIIVQPNRGDSGVYFLQGSLDNSSTCTILRAAVTVRDTFPRCTTLLMSMMSENKHLNLTCAWMYFDEYEKMLLTVGNHTLHLHENRQLKGSTAVSSNTETIISSLIDLHDTFEDNRIPDACQISTSRLEFENRCEFSVFMSPKKQEINKDNGGVIFTCCTSSNDTLPSVWWYTKNSDLIQMNTSGQWFGVDVESNGSRENGTSSVVLICGEENSNNSLLVFGIGEIDLPSKDDNEVLLSGKIEQDGKNSAQNESKCSQAGVFKITVTAIRLDKEQRTQKSVSEVTDVVNSTEDFGTLCNQTYYDSLLIGIGVALVISVLLNIATLYFTNQ